MSFITHMNESRETRECVTSHVYYKESLDTHDVGNACTQVRWRLLFHCCIAHPTIMIRNSALLQCGGYLHASPPPPAFPSPFLLPPLLLHGTRRILRFMVMIGGSLAPAIVLLLLFYFDLFNHSKRKLFRCSGEWWCIRGGEGGSKV